jgi:hypothetical protein
MSEQSDKQLGPHLRFLRIRPTAIELIQTCRPLHKKPKQCPLFVFFVISFFRVFVIVLFPIHHENSKVRKRERLFSRNFATTLRTPSRNALWHASPDHATALSETFGRLRERVGRPVHSADLSTAQSNKSKKVFNVALCGMPFAKFSSSRVLLRLTSAPRTGVFSGDALSGMTGIFSWRVQAETDSKES